jgi:hypothetical protein
VICPRSVYSSRFHLSFGFVSTIPFRWPLTLSRWCDYVTRNVPNTCTYHNMVHTYNYVFSIAARAQPSRHAADAAGTYRKWPAISFYNSFYQLIWFYTICGTSVSAESFFFFSLNIVIFLDGQHNNNTIIAREMRSFHNYFSNETQYRTFEHLCESKTKLTS